MSSKRLRKCPACGEKKLDRLVGTGAGVIFKGSGFYETDYKRSSTPPPSESESSSSSSDAGGGDSKKSDDTSSSKDSSSSKEG